MPATPFYGVGQGDPVRMQRKFGFQAALGVPAASAALTDFLSNGGPVAPSPTWLRRAVIKASAMQQAALASKTDVTGGPLDMGDLDLGNRVQLQLILSVLEKYNTATISGAHVRHKMSGAQASAPAVNAGTLWTDDDNGLPTRYVDVRAQGFTLVCQNRGNVRLTVPVAPGKYDQHGAVSQEVGTGSTLPELRHTWPGNREEDGGDDTDIYVKVTDAAPALKIKVKVGAATTYDGAEIAVTPGVWQYLYYLTGNAPLGSRAEQIQVYWPLTPTLADNDEFKILRRRARWTPSYGTPRVMAETQARFYLEGSEEIVIDGGWTLTVAVPGVETLYAPGTAQPTGTFRSGEQEVTLQIVRRKIDNTLERALLDRAVKAVVLELKNDTLIGATTSYFGADIVLPGCHFSGRGWTTEAGGQNREETFDLMCKEPASAFSWRGSNVTADIEVWADTDIATIA